MNSSMFPLELQICRSFDWRDQDNFSFIPFVPKRTRVNQNMATRPSHSEALKKGIG